MKQTTVAVNNLADAIVKELENYSKTTAEAVKESVDKVAKECVNDIKSNIDSSGIKKRTGKYRASWKSATTSENSQKRIKMVYSKKYYYLSHLLENGHAKTSGGRVEGHPHIAPAAQKAEDTLLKLIKGDVK